MMQATDNPLNKTGRCLLSLDGGGVRGLSTLLILKALMAKVNEERVKDGQSTVKPCELFDLIGGTSTGGIIAIMLGRLGMDIEECIDTYTKVSKTIFSKKGLPVNMFGKIKGRFDSIVLEECIRTILKKRGLSGDEPLINGEDGGCKVFVCAKAAEITTTVLLRSYKSRDALNNIPVTICEAVRATSAATSFFEPVTIEPRGRTFVDGGLGANNPIEHIWNEAQNIWCSGNGELSEVLKCFVSVGTGNPGKKPIADGALKFFSETLVNIATQTEDVAKVFAERHRRLYESKRFFRFNVQQGLQGVGLEEYQKEALIDAATTEYMDLQETKSAAEECALNLKQKQFQLEFSPADIIEWNDAMRRNARDKQGPFTLIPFARNDGFVTRDGPLNTLEKLLSLDTTYHTAAIWGLGGCGKTQIALEYAYRRRKKTPCSIFWVHADNEARFIQHYTGIAKLAGLSPGLKGEDLLRAVQQWMEQQTNWLLVLDNADDLKIFKETFSVLPEQKHQSRSPKLYQFIPKCSSGTVIWTSRDGGIVGHLVGVEQGIQVSTMTDQESMRLFQKLSQTPITPEPSECEKQLLEILGNLPLAIAQAAAYLRKTKVSVLRYLALFKESEERRSDLLSKEFEDLHRSYVPNSVMQTWLISMAQIAKESQCAERILTTIAFLDNKGLPFELLKRAAGSTYSEDDVLLAAGRLHEYSFLQIQRATDESLPIYEEHRLVQLATRRALTAEQISSFSGRALRIMSKVFPSGEHETWNECKLYLPHSLKAAAWREAESFNKQAPPLLARISTYYWMDGRSDEAEKLQIEVLELRKSLLGEKHPNTITAMANLASAWRQQGRFNEAEKLEIEVLELQRSVFGEKHPNTINAIANLASTWRQQSRFNEAEKLEIKVLELRKSLLGEKHPDTIKTMGNLASTWRQQGRFNDAEKLEIEVLELGKSVLREKHPDTIRAMGNLASTWWRQGRFNEAEKLQTEVLKLRKSVLGEKHPDTINAMNNLAWIWRLQNRFKEAEKLQIEVLKLGKSVLGEKHPNTINVMVNLASTWQQQGRFNEAEKLQIEILKLRKNLFGEKHPDTISAMANLASLRLEQHGAKQPGAGAT